MFCHMTSLGACGDGGWTLVMKMDGAQVRTSFIVLSFKSFICQIQTCGVASLYISDAIFCVLICFTGLPNTVKVMSSQSTNDKVFFVLKHRELFTMILNSGATTNLSTLKQGRLVLTYKRPSYRHTGTLPSLRSVLE